MRPVLLLAVTAFLTACRPGEPVPETTAPTTVTEAELLAAEGVIVAEPLTFQVTRQGEVVLP